MLCAVALNDSSNSPEYLVAPAAKSGCGIKDGVVGPRVSPLALCPEECWEVGRTVRGHRGANHTTRLPPFPSTPSHPWLHPIPLSLGVISEPASPSHLILKFGICPERPDPCLLELRTVTLPD